MKCMVCLSEEHETRPYGANCSNICFDCMMATPETEAAASKNFLLQLDAAGPLVVIGEESGPYPAQHNPTIMGTIQ